MIKRNPFRLYGSILLLGFASGLPLVLTSSTLQAWLTKSGVSIVTIGWFSLVGQPYVYKFLWAPLLDRFAPPVLNQHLDRRRAWTFVMQCCLIISLVWIAFLHPSRNVELMGFVALLISVFSATQDTAYDAYRTDILKPKERGMGSAIMVTGYRIAIIISGGVALAFAEYHGWRATYLLMAFLMLMGLIGSCWAPKVTVHAKPPATVHSAFTGPIKEFFSRSNAWIILVFIILYKLGDAFTLSLSTTFLLRGLHFTLIDLAFINKAGGLFAVIAGGFLGGFIMMRVKLFSALLWFGVLQAVSNLTYMLLAVVGKSYVMMATAVLLEHICSGMGTAAFLAFLMVLCDHRFSAAQFALFSALSAVGRVYVGPVAGVMVEHMGWVEFYFWTFASALPGLAVLLYLRNRVCFDRA